ncbi:MAG: energy transducer TonB [Pyrinomonadaceae bacterium]|nr:energy transducer TonB [Pyrinomonadaceae bacterium]
MKSLLKIVCAGLLTTLLVCTAFGQRPRISESSGTDDQPAPAPATVKAKYEGGIFGYNQKQDGTLFFDDVNTRLVFRNKYGKELFSIPYAAVLSTFGDTQSRRPTAASVIGSAVPYGLGLPALFIKKKYRYLTMQFEDPDTRVAGATSFKLENKETLASVVNTLGKKAGLTQRGEVFVRVRPKMEPVSSASTAIFRVDDREPVESGVLNGRAISLPQPEYPREARDAKVTGNVTVQVIVDEKGDVISAKAISGHPMLQQAAVDAARQAKFAPTTAGNQPVKVSGLITYNFEIR